jgi:hypothetical protein
VSLHSLPNAGQRYELNRKQTSKNALLTYEEEFFLSAGLHRVNHGVGSSDHFQEPVILIMIHYYLNSHITCLDK